ncbi:MAG: CCA tRNA nucleotidyltransferase [Bacilli bacterium]|jgi:tRNA nucleotidyltransferase/poly(A) polymerase
MDQHVLKTYFDLIPLFASEGFHLYLVGGAVRDYLLGLQPDDFDLATDATPEQMMEFLPDAKITFARFGNVQFSFNHQLFDVTTLRKEGDYRDLRHPSKVHFVQNISEDYQRRDFTINALYLSEDGKIHDFTTGISDLANGIIRMIGDPLIRLKEDPLRILRALRLQVTYGFKLEESLKEAMRELSHLVSRLTPAKINCEIMRMEEIDKEKTQQLLLRFGLKSRY